MATDGRRRSSERHGSSAGSLRGILLLLLAQAAGILWADREAGLGLPIAVLGVLAGVLAGASRCCGRPGWRRRSALWLALGALSFALGHQALTRELERARRDADRAERLDPKRIRLVDARVSARRATSFGEEIELVDVRSRAGDERVPERLVLGLAPGASRGDRLLWPGARVRIGVVVTPLRPPRNPGSPDREHVLARRGLAARARLVKPDWVVERIASDERLGPLSTGLARLRRDVAERVRLRLASVGAGRADVGGAGLVRALALGDRRALSDETRRAFRALGLAHLISVSGLHIGFVALPAAWSIARLRTLARPHRRPVLGFAAPVAIGCVVAACYAWLTGAGVPALRASLLFAFFGIARVCGASLAPAPTLAGLALLLLVAHPAHLFDLGALFSFTACAALIAGGAWGGPGPAAEATPAAGADGPSGRGSDRGRRSRAALLDPVRASLAVSIGMLPLVELAGLPRALASPLVNAAAIPWTGVVVMPCALAASVLACALPADLGDGLLALLLRPAAWLEQAAGTVAAGLPASAIGEDRPGRLPWMGALALGGLALARLRAGDWVTGASVWTGLALLGLAPVRGPAFTDPTPRVVFLDVGQADAALVQAGRATWLIDSGSGPEDGSGGATVLRALRAQGVDRIDVLVITHGDLDHRGGARRILSAVNVGELWLPAPAAADPGLASLAEVARARGVSVRWVVAGDRAGPGDALAVEVLWPPERSRPVGRGRTRNDLSIVLRLELDGRSFLFAGDVGEAVEQRLVEGGSSLRAAVLKVAHHGSRTSSSARFLAAVAPEMAVVSAPCGAGRGLPSEPALDRLRASGAALGWTGRDGAVAVVVGRDAAAGATSENGEGAAALRMRYWGEARRCVPDRGRSGVTGEGG